MQSLNTSIKKNMLTVVCGIVSYMYFNVSNSKAILPLACCCASFLVYCPYRAALRS